MAKLNFQCKLLNVSVYDYIMLSISAYHYNSLHTLFIFGIVHWWKEGSTLQALTLLPSSRTAPACKSFIQWGARSNDNQHVLMLPLDTLHFLNMLQSYTGAGGKSRDWRRASISRSKMGHHWPVHLHAFYILWSLNVCNSRWSGPYHAIRRPDLWNENWGYF